MRAPKVAVMGGAAAAFFAAVSGNAQDAPGGGPTAVAVADEGRQIYVQICQACHLADAKGGGGAGAVIPALAGNRNLADPKFMIEVLMKGRGGMPWFNDMLTPRQMAAVINYVRTRFNAYRGTVSEADVAAFAAASGKPGWAECATCN